MGEGAGGTKGTLKIHVDFQMIHDNMHGSGSRSEYFRAPGNVGSLSQNFLCTGKYLNCCAKPAFSFRYESESIPAKFRIRYDSESESESCSNG